MLTLYSYPKMFGVPDNNPFGLKVWAFLRLAKIDFQHEHIIDTSNAPRGQLPYLTDDEKIISDSNMMIDYLTEKYHINIDNDLSAEQKAIYFTTVRMLDSHMYWIMSYSRWQDKQYWPLFKAEFLRLFPSASSEQMEEIRGRNLQRYYQQGIGRYTPEEIYSFGIKNLQAIKTLLGEKQFFFGDTPKTIDTSIYGFLATIYYFKIDTPLKQFISKNKSLEHYVKRVHAHLTQ